MVWKMVPWLSQLAQVESGAKRASKRDNWNCSLQAQFQKWRMLPSIRRRLWYRPLVFNLQWTLSSPTLNLKMGKASWTRFIGLRRLKTLMQWTWCWKSILKTMWLHLSWPTRKRGEQLLQISSKAETADGQGAPALKKAKKWALGWACNRIFRQRETLGSAMSSAKAALLVIASFYIQLLKLSSFWSFIAALRQDWICLMNLCSKPCGF